MLNDLRSHVDRLDKLDIAQRLYRLDATHQSEDDWDQPDASAPHPERRAARH